MLLRHEMGVVKELFILAGLWLLCTTASASQCYIDAKSAYQALLLRDEAVKAVNDKVNINTATAGELATLQGIGAKTAESIISYREAFGWFRSVEDLTHVKGVGTKTLEKNRHKIVVD